ncbi:MAG TPA: amidohydrolase family protein [Vicinamibacterales bacterium]|jgi:cytosine/adenosine deaminase-related metal-dependent hydrolase|nr:amidohydrolase family protein [Vicinamibacterales bacterium]
MMWGRAVSIVNAAGAAGAAGDAGDRGIGSLRFTSRIVAIDAPPKRGDTVIDAQGSWILPGLVNAHDHLELNHYGRLKFRDRYENATEWIGDMRPRLGADAAIRRGQGHPLTERLFIGALKNLLAGVTTVAHHNPYYTELRRTMPIRVVRRYGWAHSFALSREPAGARGEPGGDVVQRWSRTSADAPFFVHIAEGVDEEAGRELSRLDALGCLTPNTVVIHGVAINAGGLRRIVDADAGLVWCPGSNMFLFGRTAAVRLLLDAARGRPCPVALGSDSRLTGSNDLLDELRVARDTRCASPFELLEMVTTNPARLLRLRRAGRLAVGDPADFIVVPRSDGDAAAALLAAARRDIELVVVGGRPLVASAPFVDVFRARSAVARPLTVDGVSKLGESGLVRRIAGCPIVEPGVSAG